MTRLSREVGLGGAVLMGLGSIVGTGVFVSLGLGAGLAGPAVVVALLLAAVLATFNGLSSAQLAANHPVSGGTYEYAHLLVGPRAGFTAGFMFLTAKSASAATAALGFAGYLLHLLGIADGWTVPVALLGVGLLTGLVYGGIRRTSVVNAVVVSLTLAVLGLLVLLGLPAVEVGRLAPTTVDVPGVLEASALMFVAYTGYGRIATLGEEVLEPRRTIPRAIVVALLAVLALYVAVAVTAVGVLGSAAYAEETRASAAPLEAVARALGHPWLARVVSAAAVTAMVGVMINLLLGLSRVLLAMGRRGDAPRLFGRVARSTPGPAVLATGAGIALLVLIGDVKTTWTFSAFTVLVYYALTNVSALRLPAEQRLYPTWTAWAGLVGCAGLAVFIEPAIWAAGLGLLALGHAARAVARR